MFSIIRGMRLLLVYGFEPSGHASAAIALQAAAKARGLEAERLNVSLHHRWFGPAVARAYMALIQRFPGVWRALYDNERVANVALAWRRIYLILNHRKLERTLARLRPDVIVCTHAPPLGALALEKERGGLSCPLAGVVTDFKAHTYWIRPGADLYLAPTQAAAAEMVRRGIPEENLRVTGIPIHPAFAAALPPAEARRRLGLPQGAPVVTLSGGSRGLGKISSVAEALLAKLPAARILVLTGVNRPLFRHLKARHRGQGRLWVYPALDAPRMAEVLAASDLLVGKAGGLSVSEALAVGVPIIIFEPIPGQEAENAAFLSSSGAALVAPTLEDAAGLAASALEPGRLAALKARARALGRPDSADRAVAAIVEAFSSVK